MTIPASINNTYHLKRGQKWPKINKLLILFHKGYTLISDTHVRDEKEYISWSGSGKQLERIKATTKIRAQIVVGAFQLYITLLGSKGIFNRVKK